MNKLFLFLVLLIIFPVVSAQCNYEGKTYEYGEYNLEKLFCDLSGDMLNQKEIGLDCYNSGECLSGFCTNGICYNLQNEAEKLGEIGQKIANMPYDIIAKNKKNEEKYASREVFLVSSKDWKTVMSLVPVTTWTDGEVNKYPTLIFHEDKTSIDADSIIYFLNQYQNGDETVTIVGDAPIELVALVADKNIEFGAKLGVDNVKRITINDLYSYWESFDTIVYVEDDYKTSLLAASYASLINAPLVIEGTSLDSEYVTDRRKLICVGNVKKECDFTYTIKDMQKKIVEETNTDKIILVNPSDLFIDNGLTLNPKLTPGSIEGLFKANSLSAPYLAGARHEVIFFADSDDYKEIDAKLESEIREIVPYFINNEEGIKANNYVAAPKYIKYLPDGESELFYSGYIYEFIKEGGLLKYWVGSKVFFYNETSKELQVYVLPYKSENYVIDGDKIVYSEYWQFLSDKIGIYNTSTRTSKIIAEVEGSVRELAFDGDYVIWVGLSEDKFKLHLYRLSTGETELISEAPITKGISRIGVSNGRIVWNTIGEEGYETFIYENGVEKIESEGSSFLKINKNYIIINKYNYLSKMNEAWSYNILTGQKKKIMDQSGYTNILTDEYFGLLETRSEGEGLTCSLSGASCIDYEDCPSLCEKSGEVCGGQISCPSGERCVWQSCIATDLFLYNFDTGLITSYDMPANTQKFYPTENGPIITYWESNHYTIFGYLTIIAGSQVIPIKENVYMTSHSNYRSLDQTEYGDTYPKDSYPDMAVGRIQGFTTSDSSSQIARGLFLEDMPRDRRTVFMASSSDYKLKNSDIWNGQFKEIGYDSICSVQPTETSGEDFDCEIVKTSSTWPELWEDRELIAYADHGSKGWAGISSWQIPSLDNSIITNAACLTCSSEFDSSFCHVAIRKGALAHYGALSIAWSNNHIYKWIIDGIYKDDLTIGMAFAKAYDSSTMRYMTHMLGDPALNINPKAFLGGELMWGRY